jgi:drug/metabolite transporter (DMT)-like permease
MGIKFQLGSVDPMVSVLYRFTAATLILMTYCNMAGLKMRFCPKDHAFMALQGLMLFSVNYWVIYLASVHLTSGVVAVIFSSIVFMNMINGALFMGAPIRSRVLLGGGIGILGIGLVFWPEISSFSLTDKAALGIGLAATSTFMASLGNIISARHQKYHLPVIQTNAYGMAYGAVIIGILTLFSGKTYNFDTSPVYIGSLIYLAVFGTVIAFGCYLKLIGKIGADRAAYATMLFPVVALAISTFFENYHWSALNLIGMVLVLAGNGLVLNKRSLKAS